MLILAGCAGGKTSDNRNPEVSNFLGLWEGQANGVPFWLFIKGPDDIRLDIYRANCSVNFQADSMTKDGLGIAFVGTSPNNCGDVNEDFAYQLNKKSSEELVLIPKDENGASHKLTAVTSQELERQLDTGQITLEKSRANCSSIPSCSPGDLLCSGMQSMWCSKELGDELDIQLTEIYISELKEMGL